MEPVFNQEYRDALLARLKAADDKMYAAIQRNTPEDTIEGLAHDVTGAQLDVVDYDSAVKGRPQVLEDALKKYRAELREEIRRRQERKTNM
jgi:hypothetical protein